MTPAIPAILSLNIGRPQLSVHEGVPYSTAINKKPVAGPVELGPESLVGDRVADRNVHGGPDKAMLIFAHEHYGDYARKLGVELAIPAFGENLTTTGLLEEEVCVGDIYAIGSAIVQVSQPRQPCFKLARKHNSAQLLRWVERSAHSGFYVRVLQTGVIQAGEAVTLTQRPHPGVSVASVFQSLFWRDAPLEQLQRAAAADAISPGWKRRLNDRLQARLKQPNLPLPGAQDT